MVIPVDIVPDDDPRGIVCDQGSPQSVLELEAAIKNKYSIHRSR
jgi:hypothetical protein